MEYRVSWRSLVPVTSCGLHAAYAILTDLSVPYSGGHHENNVKMSHQFLFSLEDWCLRCPPAMNI